MSVNDRERRRVELFGMKCLGSVSGGEHNECDREELNGKNEQV